MPVGVPGARYSLVKGERKVRSVLSPRLEGKYCRSSSVCTEEFQCAWQALWVKEFFPMSQKISKMVAFSEPSPANEGRRSETSILVTNISTVSLGGEKCRWKRKIICLKILRCPLISLSKKKSNLMLAVRTSWVKSMLRIIVQTNYRYA